MKRFCVRVREELTNSVERFWVPVNYSNVSDRKEPQVCSTRWSAARKLSLPSNLFNSSKKSKIGEAQREATGLVFISLSCFIFCRSI